MCVCTEDGRREGSPATPPQLQSGCRLQLQQGSIFNISAETLHHPHRQLQPRARDLDAGVHLAAQPLAHTLGGQQRCGHILLATRSHTLTWTKDSYYLLSSPFPAAALGTLEFDLLYDQASCMLHCRILRAKVCIPPS